MLPSRLIEAKRDGAEIPEDDLRAFLSAFLADELPEYQMSAFLMAVVFRGMTPAELSCVVDAMLHSGERLSWDALDRPVVDKHSTGGVGDKVSLILAPLAAELGLAVPMMSGRGLGHSGGTLDKLESIPGFRTQIPLDEFGSILRDVGCAMIGQTDEIAPLDRRMYALRNVSGTVPAIPLITSSIMSKKLAEGLDVLVLDVKHGSGAFIPDTEDALDLCRTMVGVGERFGVRTVGLLTAMDRPLGVMAGNALEVAESIDVLRGEGPADTRAVTVALTAELLVSSGTESDVDTATRVCEAVLDSGRALDRFRRLVEAQGGDASVVDDPSGLAQAPIRHPVVAAVPGIVQEVRPRPLGWSVVELGGGRRELGDTIDPAVGFEILAKPGTSVVPGDVLAVVHARTEDGARAGERAVREAWTIGEDVPEALPLVSHRLSIDDVRSVD